MSIITITKDNFQREVMSSRKPVLMEFLGALVRPVQNAVAGGGGNRRGSGPRQGRQGEHRRTA